MDEVAAKGMPQTEHVSLDRVLPETDVLYVTRVQRERFEDAADYEKVKDAFVITPEVMKPAKDEMIVMHPLPRVTEISHGLRRRSRGRPTSARWNTASTSGWPCWPWSWARPDAPPASLDRIDRVAEIAIDKP